MLHQRLMPYLFVFLKKKISNMENHILDVQILRKGAPQYFSHFYCCIKKNNSQLNTKQKGKPNNLNPYKKWRSMRHKALI
jgi:hypothetical protein